jgi:hypothetical protein
MEYQIPPQQGWQCPICGRIMAPSQPFCMFCEGSNATISSDGTGIKWPHEDSKTVPKNGVNYTPDSTTDGKEHAPSCIP